MAEVGMTQDFGFQTCALQPPHHTLTKFIWPFLVVRRTDLRMAQKNTKKHKKIAANLNKVNKSIHSITICPLESEGQISSIPLYKYTKTCLSIHLLIEIFTCSWFLGRRLL